MQVSVVIPTRNRNEYLTLLLESVKGVADEVVVRDNANGVARVLVERFPWVRWIFGPELPVLANWRECLDAATSEFVAISSDDDLYLPNCAAVLQRIAGEVADADVIIAGHRTIDSNGRTTGEWRPPRHELVAPPDGFLRFQFGVPARMQSIFFRNSFLRRIGSLDTSFQLTAADSELVQRAMLFGRVLFVPEVISAYRVWPGGSTAQTQMTPLWMAEIEKWSAKMAPVAELECGRARARFDSARYVDELFATNLVAGMYRAAGQGRYGEALRFFREMRFPWRATLRTRMALARLLLGVVAREARLRFARGGSAQQP